MFYNSEPSPSFLWLFVATTKMWVFCFAKILLSQEFAFSDESVDWTLALSEQTNLVFVWRKGWFKQKRWGLYLAILVFCRRINEDFATLIRVSLKMEVPWIHSLVAHHTFQDCDLQGYLSVSGTFMYVYWLPMINMLRNADHHQRDP